jgi:hypothetical protein
MKTCKIACEMLEKINKNKEFMMIVRTYCARMDHGDWDLAHAENGKIVKIEGDLLLPKKEHLCEGLSNRG